MGRRSIGVLVAGGLLAAVGASCGGDEDGVASASPAKSVYVKKANSICQKTYAQTKEKYSDFVKDRGEEAFEDPKAVEEFVDTVIIPRREQMVEKLLGLGSPEGDERQIEEVIEAYEEGIDVAGEDPELAATSTFGVFARANDLAQDYGLEECNA